METTSEPGTWRLEPPSHRLDLLQEIDLIEEIARLVGYTGIPSAPPPVSASFSQLGNPTPFEPEIRFLFHQAGLREAVNASFLPETFADQLRLGDSHPLRRYARLQNPIADDQKVMRPTLLPSLLSNARLNLAHQQDSVYFYELNKVFQEGENKEILERVQAAALLAGNVPGAGWSSPERKTDFYDLKGLAENIVAYCRLEGARWFFGKASLPYFSLESLEVQGKEGTAILWGGAVHPKVLGSFGISVPCFALELDFPAMAQAASKSAAFSALPKFPAAWRDIALIVPDGVTSDEVLAAIASQGAPTLKKAALFDLYRGANVPNGFRSLAYRLHFQDTGRTLTDAEVAGKVSRILDHLKERFSIVLR